MAQGIDAFMKRNEESCLLASEEQTRSEPEFNELAVGNDSVLPLGQRPNRSRCLPIPHRSHPPLRTAST